MSTRKVSFAEGEYYHIYSRGNSKQDIFFDDHDRDRFTKLLYLCNSEKSVDFREDIVRKNIDAWDFERGDRLVSIGVWVLMGNHFHLYLTVNPHRGVRKQDFRKNEISEFMHKVLTSYSKYINAKYKRTGGLFEGKFKDVHVIGDNQAKYLFSYIHLNPIKFIDRDWKVNGVKDWKKSIEFLKQYRWSSYLDYKGISRPESKIINPEDFPSYFQNMKDFDSEIIEWLNFKEKGFE